MIEEKIDSLTPISLRRAGRSECDPHRALPGKILRRDREGGGLAEQLPMPHILPAHADRFAVRYARVFSRSSAKRKNSRLVERYISRSSKLEALWYSLLYSSARLWHSAMRSLTLYDMATSLRSDVRLECGAFASADCGTARRLPTFPQESYAKRKQKSVLFAMRRFCDNSCCCTVAPHFAAGQGGHLLIRTS